MAIAELYPRSRTAALDAELFAHPTCEYRGAPFWSWNNKLDRDQILRQIDYLHAMGLGGYHIHCRTGLDTPYLGEEYLGIVKACVEKGKRLGMLTWLYDEDRWPSGFAGGLVTQDERFRARHLLFTPRPYAGHGTAEGVNNSGAFGARAENGRLLARYAVTLRQGLLHDYRRLAEGEPAPAGATLWYAYLEVARPANWFNGQTYADTLNPAAIRRFVEVTHERFLATVGADFGRAVPAIFTDEPQFTHKQFFRWADEQRDLAIPFTDDLLETFAAAYGSRLEDALPELFWELPGGRVSLVRYRYHDHVAERFAAAFADTVGNWCDAHGIALTGHMMDEPTLHSQTGALGEAMRSYRSFQLPGIDMLCHSREYTTAKQAQSATHQYGRPGVLSELYGVTNWDYDFVGHKAQGDWQAALGITVRVHHLSWVSMAGEAKRDYPASISYQSPWFREYATVEDHFARVNTALTRGQPLVRVGVIHPIESFWLCFGPWEQTRPERDERENQFRDLTNWLLFGLTDFNFIAESLLPSQCPAVTGNRFPVGRMQYDAIVVPPMRTIRSTTLDRLEAFAAHGGRLLFAGEVPTLVDAQPSDRAQRLAARALQVPFTQPRLLAALEPVRVLEARHDDGGPATSLLHQVRQDGDRRFVFFCNTDEQNPRPGIRLRFAGQWAVTWLDTLTGRQQPLAATHNNGQTELRWDFPAHGHLLVQLAPAAASPGATVRQPREAELARLVSPVPVTLSEPNVLLLDQAEWRLNDGAWQPREEILRLENLARAGLGLKPQSGDVVQPWVVPADPTVLGHVELRFQLKCGVRVVRPRLALEAPQDVTLTLDGEPVPVKDAGWYIDEAIRVVRLPSLKRGDHTLCLRYAYRRKSNLEWCYLLGDFGVTVRGRDAAIVAPVRELAFGDWSTQGLPFYGGNVTYHCRLTGDGRPLRLVAPRFANPLLTVDLAGRRVGPIAFAPFALDLGAVQGEQALDLTAYGNRYNTLACLHRVSDGRRYFWAGPGCWRTTGNAWTYEYQLKPTGVLVAPQVHLATEG
jgi:hypothetical protein